MKTPHSTMLLSLLMVDVLEVKCACPAVTRNPTSGQEIWLMFQLTCADCWPRAASSKKSWRMASPFGC